MLIPTGFWSYTNSDNSSSQGKISKLRTSLCDELQQQIGREPKVSIFEIPPKLRRGANGKIEFVWRLRTLRS